MEGCELLRSLARSFTDLTWKIDDWGREAWRNRLGVLAWIGWAFLGWWVLEVATTALFGANAGASVGGLVVGPVIGHGVFRQLYRRARGQQG